MSAKFALTEQTDIESFKILKIREEFRDQYWLKRDPIYEDRLLWRAQTFRHMVHLLPNQTILELGTGKGLFTRQLVRVSRGENPITSISFNPYNDGPIDLSSSAEFFNVSSAFPAQVSGKRFDVIVGIDLLDQNNCSWVLKEVYKLLKPGGQVIFYESNPWNVVLRFRRLVQVIFGQKDPRRLLNRTDLYELFSEIGFIRVSAIFNDFVYKPLTQSLAWFLRNLSILLENTPYVQNLAGSIMIHAQKPPHVHELPKLSLFEHEQLRKAVSVVIPCHNEETNIEPLVCRLKNFFGEYIHEVIIIDDNSQDRTGEVIRRLANEDPIIKLIFRSPPNGVGRAIADGFKVATGKYILSMDCDFQQLLPEIRDMFDALAEGYDVVVGSRFSRHSVLLNYPLNKVIANRGFHLLAQMMFLRKFRDLTNNLKLMKREVVKRLQLTEPGFAVNAETGLQPLLMGYSLKEVPISWINRNQDMGTSSFRLLNAGGGYLKVLFRLWLNNLVRGSNNKR